MDDPVRINTPGAAGIDRRSETLDVAALACLDMNNLDIFPADTPEGSRVLPRRWTRRWGQRSAKISTSLQAGPGLTGDYYHAFIWTDAAGITHYSFTSDTLTAANQVIRVTGWPTSAGTVAIYRTTGGGATLKLVVTGLDVTVNSFYDDIIADGALGADMGAVPAHIDPLGLDTFAQANRFDALVCHKNESGSTDLLSALVGGTYHVGTPKTSELMQERGTYTTNADCPVQPALLGDLIWIPGGTNLRYRTLASGGDVASATQPAAPVISSPGTAAGTLATVVSHKYVVQTEHKITGIRSAPSNVLSFGAAAARTINLSWTNTSSSVRSHLYRTTDGGSFFQLVTTLETASTYGDTIADASLSQQTVPFEVGAAGEFRFLWAHKGILFAAYDLGNDNSALVRWSNAEYPHNFPNDAGIAPEYEFKIDEDDGDEITGGFSWGEASIVFKKRRVYLITGDPPKGFRWAPVPGSDGLGCVGWRTIRETPIGLLWLSPAGICLMTSPGAAPTVLSDAIRDVFVEPQRHASALQLSTLTEEPADLRWDYAPAGTADENIQVNVQFDTTPAFSTPDFDYDTENATERAYFLANNAAFPAAGFDVRPGQKLRISLRPPAPAAGPTPEVLYYVRYRVKIDAGAWGAWTTLTASYTKPLDDPYDDAPVTNKLPWAWAVHYPPRSEYWLGLPTGDRYYSAVAWVMNYAPMLSGGPPVFRRVTMPVSAACLIQDWSVDSLAKADYLLFASPDGLLFAYPFVRDGIDADTRVTVADADRRVTATHSASTTLTASGTAWSTSRYKLKGCVVTARDPVSERTFTGIITNNTGTTLTVAWLSGQTPPNIDLEIAVGGLDAFIDLPWWSLGGPGLTGTLRMIGIRASSPATTLRVVIRAGREARRRLSEAVGLGFNAPIGRGFENFRRTIYRRGHFHQVRYGTINNAELWEVSQLELLTESTGSRV